jgi:hypothetical protein
MKRLFPNIETAIIFVFLLCVMLWGVSRCNRKKEDLSIKAVESSSTSAMDSIISPAARPLPKPAPIPSSNMPTTDPSTPIANTTPQYPSSTPPTIPTAQPATTVTTPSVPTPADVKVVPSTATTPVKPNSTPAPNPSVQAGKTTLYVLINGLNVRTKPELNAKSLGKLKINDQVYFLNEVTEAAQTVRLIDGTEVTKPWFKIQTKKGTIGWVHGSGVDFYKRKPQGGL